MKKDLLLTVKLFLGWILGLFLIALLGGILFGDIKTLNILSLENWDGKHFAEIAMQGYIQKTDYAFFPLYPLLISLVSKVLFNNFFIAGLLISLLSAFGSIYLFLKILKQLKEKDVTKTLIYFLIFPTSFYLLTVYSESLFLFLTLLSFYFAFEKKFEKGGLFAIFAPLVRISGVATVAGFLMESFLSKSNRNRKIIFLFSLVGILGYCLFLYLTRGNPFYFLIAESHWERVVTFPGRNIWEAILFLNYYGINSLNYTVFLDLAFCIFGIGMGLRTVRFLRPSLYIYTLVSLLIPLSTSILLSFPRFLIVIFPIFIMIGRIKNKAFLVTYVIISLTFLFIYFNFFLRSLWVS